MKKSPSKNRNSVIHFVHFTSRPGGIEVLLPVIVKNLPGYDFKGFVIRKPTPGEDNIYDSMNIPVEYGSCNKIKALLRAFNYFRKNRNDILQCFNTGPLYLIIIRLSGVKKVIYSIHGTIHWKSRFKKLLLKTLWYVVLKSDYKITSNSEYSKNVFLNKINPSTDIKVIYNPVDDNKFTLAKNLSHSGLKVIYTGRLCKGKNLERWIEVASLIHNSINDTQFEIYGYGPLMESLKHQIDQQNADNYVKLKGFRKDIDNVYREADILLFLSDYESFGNVAVESILCSTPVIVSDIPSMREIFRDFPEFIIKIDDNLEDNVLHKLNEIDKLKELTLKARDQFLKRFSVEAHTTAIDIVYRSFSG